MVATSLNLTNAQNAAATKLHSLWTHPAVGSGTTTPTVGDTTLETETYRERYQRGSYQRKKPP